MTDVVKFTFNPFQENTYILYDETKECAIIDPGCFEPHEKDALTGFIEQHGLRPVQLINTHCHIDHILGNQFVANTYGLQLAAHRGEIPVLEVTPQVAMMYGMPYPEPSPPIEIFLEAGDTISFGNTQLAVLYTPGHSPASISLYCEASNFVIAGDVLFKESIGRTDLPGGNLETLLESIRTQLLPLGDEVVVYPGHMAHTTIGEEKRNNPFLNGVM